MDNQKDIIELAKDLSLSDLETLLWIFKDHLSVYVGRQNNHQIGGDIESICFNGASIQINMEFAELKSLSDDSFIKSAFYGDAPNSALMGEAYEALQNIVALNDLHADLSAIDEAYTRGQAIIDKIEGAEND